MDDKLIFNNIAGALMDRWNIDEFEQTHPRLLAVILKAMESARIDEHCIIKESVNPEEPKNGFNDDLLKKEILKHINESKHKPIAIRINPDDWFQFVEVHRLTTGARMHPSPDGDWYWAGLKIDLIRDVDAGKWFLI